jgi:glycosyltransferase involved in cell wall biosynthesis
MRRLHVAILDEELPFPLTSGKRIRTYHLLSRLAARHRLTYLCHRNPDPDESTAADRAWRELGVRTVVVEHRVPPKSGPGFYARLAANLVSPLPYSVASHRSAELRAAAAALLAADPPDLWHCEWTPYAQTLRRPLGSAPWVVMAHNVESLIWQRFAEAEGHPLKRWYVRRQFHKFERFERWAYSSCDCAIAVSEEDARLMRERFGARNTAVVDNGVDTAAFTLGPPAARDPRRVLFLGSLDWRPNLDAARLLLDDIFPRVRAQEPRATLALVGRRPAAWLRERVPAVPGVELHADVPDVRPFLAGAGMLAVPLRIGGGSRLKILEALAAGVPVVSTRVGAEGLHLEPGRHFTLADSPEAMARGILQLMHDPDAARRQAAAGQAAVLERYDWSGLADKLEEVWLRAAGESGQLQISPQVCTV